MKRTYDGAIYNSALTASAGASELTAEEKAALKSEIANDPKSRGYAGKTAREILWLLGNEYQEPNPEPQGYVSRGVLDGVRVILTDQEVKQGEYAGWTYKAMIDDLATHGEPDQRKLALVAQEVCNWVTVNTSDQRVIDKIQTLAPDILSQEIVNYILYMPDPNWPEFLAPKRHLWELFGEGYVIDLSDIDEAMSG